jgi:hypothetical protein
MKRVTISKVMLGLLAIVAGMSMVTTASAASATSCSDISFSAETMGRYPDIDEACLEIKDGEDGQHARLQAKVVRASSRTIVMKYLHTDGTYGDSYRTGELPSGFRVNVDGRQTRPRDLVRGQTLNIYVKIGATIATLKFTEDSEGMDVSMTEVADMLPKTAGWYYEMLIAGLLLLLAAGGLTARRYRSS